MLQRCVACLVDGLHLVLVVHLSKPSCVQHQHNRHAECMCPMCLAPSIKGAHLHPNGHECTGVVCSTRSPAAAAAAVLSAAAAVIATAAAAAVAFPAAAVVLPQAACCWYPGDPGCGVQPHCRAGRQTPLHNQLQVGRCSGMRGVCDEVAGAEVLLQGFVCSRDGTPCRVGGQHGMPASAGALQEAQRFEWGEGGCDEVARSQGF